MIPYANHDIEQTAAERIAQELRDSGNYWSVQIRRAQPGLNGAGEPAQFARIYVDPKREEPR